MSPRQVYVGRGRVELSRPHTTPVCLLLRSSSRRLLGPLAQRGPF